MEWFEALILGLIQGLTEYLPVSSSGHLAIGSALFDIKGEDNLAFTIVVHVATVFSTLVILWKEIDWIFRGLFKFEMNAETRYVINILISMIPIGIVDCGLLFACNGSSAYVFLLCETPPEREYIHEGCLCHRPGSGVCRASGTFPFGFDDCYRAFIG